MVKERLANMLNVNLALMRLVYYHHRRPEDLDHRIEALRKAGFPELPYGVVGRRQDRLNQGQFEALVFGRTWQGYLGSKERFVQEIGKDGLFAIFTKASLNSGTMKIRGDRLCVIQAAYSQDVCGHIYRNSAGTKAGQNEYFYVNSFQVYNFSVVN
jgi:adenylate cyclase